MRSVVDSGRLSEPRKFGLKDNIKKDHAKIVLVGVNRIHLDQDRGRRQTFANTVMNVQFHKNQIISSLVESRGLFHGVG